MTGCIDVSKIAAGLGAMLTPTIAIVTALILVLQYLLAARTWRLALYDKQYPVYKSTMRYISLIVENGTVTAAQLVLFLREARENEFLFHQEIHAFMKSLHSKGADLLTTENLAKAERDDVKRAKYIERKAEILKWFGDQLAVATRLFGRYLRV